MRRREVAVVGLGAMGLSALTHLRRRGIDAIGFERVYPGHAGGSSHGESRVFRLVNFENPAYGPLGERALELWREMERYPGEIYQNAGMLEAGPEGSELIAGTRQAMACMDAGIETMAGAEANQRFPAFDLPADWQVNHHAVGGFVRADRALACQLELVRGLDAAAVETVDVRAVNTVGERVEIVLGSGETVSAGTAIVAAGPWFNQLVDLPLPISLSRQVLGWFEPSVSEAVQIGAMPVFMIEAPQGFVYGFPAVDGRVKAAQHDIGARLDDPDHVPPASLADITVARDMLARYVPAAIDMDAPVAVKTCIYTNTSDEEFIIDRHPLHANLILLSACSGHGFKFASAIGEIAADLAMGRKPGLEISPYRLARFGKRLSS